MRLCPTFLLQRWLWLCVCARQWHCRNGNNCRLPLCVRQIWAYLRLMVDSLYYNTLTNSDVVMDSLMEPILWMVDLLTRRFGAVFVCLLVILTTSILLVVYVVMLPVIFDTYSPSWIAWHMSYGHWNLVMIVFHYYKATNTAPGYPPTMKNSIPFVSMCKKCIIPKPARTHHCAICNTCILKMDHHCHEMFHKSVIYMWVLTSVVAVSLGGLTIWHAVLISRGETSIERHLNNKETKRMRKCGKVYKNSFNYGRLNNWKVFLGVEKKSHWLTRVILPSGHVPIGNGLTWDIYPFRKDMMPV
ncbi:palmitoyltransferase ZDHHC16A isoform X3 [Oncorhynchus tshawytscha]|uniref:palmitoyltransferase ZDHHC16A isoform X3 n=1 Tax=Oncorhynchus tshawytscha TaxID=74940 RepID=UPI000D09AE8B|nr:palmitoyltransferase ZDHHC16A isoform X3 [Oncorhynchus tshawytscha]